MVEMQNKAAPVAGYQVVEKQNKTLTGRGTSPHGPCWDFEISLLELLCALLGPVGFRDVGLSARVELIVYGRRGRGHD